VNNCLLRSQFVTVTCLCPFIDLYSFLLKVDTSLLMQDQFTKSCLKGIPRRTIFVWVVFFTEFDVCLSPSLVLFFEISLVPPQNTRTSFFLRVKIVSFTESSQCCGLFTQA
jgi:hypothetical protein